MLRRIVSVQVKFLSVEQEVSCFVTGWTSVACSSWAPSSSSPSSCSPWWWGSGPRPPRTPSARWTAGPVPGCWWPSCSGRRSTGRWWWCRTPGSCPRWTWGGWGTSRPRSSFQGPRWSRRTRCGTGWTRCSPCGWAASAGPWTRRGCTPPGGCSLGCPAWPPGWLCGRRNQSVRGGGVTFFFLSITWYTTCDIHHNTCRWLWSGSRCRALHRHSSLSARLPPPATLMESQMRKTFLELHYKTAWQRSPQTADIPTLKHKMAARAT